MNRLKLVLIAGVIAALNLGIGALVLFASTSGTLQAQRENACDTEAFMALEANFVSAVASRASAENARIPFDETAFNNTRQAYVAAIQSCYAGIDVDKVRYDDDIIYLQDERFVPFGSKWGANSPFNPNNPPVTSGGVVNYSFMPNGVSMGPLETSGGNPKINVAITSLPGFQQCFLDDIRAAFAAWEAVADIDFVEVADSGAGVSIETPGAQGHIRVGSHSFDGVSGVLAHAYFPPPNGTLVSAPGDLHFDIAENWSCTDSPSQRDIGIVALHEIGHSIGLLHEPTVQAVMNPTYNGSLTGLLPDDVSGAVSIYGSNPSVTFPPLLAVSFVPSAVEQNLSGGGTMQIVITNPNTTTDLTGIIAEQDLPAGIQVVPPTLSHNCTGAAPSVTQTQVRLENFSLDTLDNCSLSIQVTGVTVGTYPNVATATANESGANEGFSMATPLRVVEAATGAYCATTDDPTWTGAKAIPDANPTGVSSTIVVPDSGLIADLDVRLNITHTYVGDVELVLTHNGTPIRLIQYPNNGSNVCSGNNIFIGFDDEAGISAQSACTNTTTVDAYTPGAMYRPAQPLSTFDGHSINGNWQLRVIDSTNTDTGHLVNWCLRPTLRVPAALGFTAQPTNTLAGASINGASGIKVRLLASDGSDVDDSGVPITLAIANNAGGGTLSGTVTANTVNGVATFTGLSIDAWGDDYTLTATSSGLISATSLAFDVAPAPGMNLIRNGSFEDEMAFWGVYSTPDPDDIQYLVEDGMFKYFRPVDSTSAVVLQNTGVPIGGNIPIHVQLQLGNTSDVRKRVILMAHHYSFSDFQICSFWIPPNSPLQTYELHTKTNFAWTEGASLSVYLSPADGTPYALIDNAVMTYQPGTPPTSTNCVDPNAPTPPGGADGVNLLTNGDFSAGFTGWGTFGSVVSNVDGNGVLNMYAPPDPSGAVVLQYTGAPIAAEMPIEARFALGNSSALRKRVTVILSTPTFNDLQVCTFWLEANTPLAEYSLQTHTTQAWDDATVSFYVSSFDNTPAYLVDDVSLITRPSLDVGGTICSPTGGGGASAPPLSVLPAEIPTLIPTATPMPASIGVPEMPVSPVEIPTETPLDEGTIGEG